MAEFPAVCVESDIDSLKDIATRFCVKHPYVFCQFNQREAGYELQEGLALPQGICEKILSVCKDELKGEELECFIKLFKDAKRTQLQLVDLSNSHVTDKILEFLTDHQITRLNISGCKLLTYAALNSVAKLRNLQSLIIGSSYQIFEMYRFKRGEMLAVLSQYDFFMRPTSIFPPPKPCEPPSFLRLPLLKNLVIHDVPKLERNLCFMSIMDFSQCLTHLDLSNCKVHLNRMNAFLESSDLVALTLRDVPNVNHLFHAICKIKTLRKLDISNTGTIVTMYDNPDKILDCIVTSLENLEHLDISGTNLAGVGIEDVYPGKYGDMTVTDIPGLASRVNRPLEFLGLLNCAYGACFRHRIPAKKIAGHATEEQLLTALESYWASEPLILKVWPYIYRIIISSTCKDTKRALDLVTQVMRQHLKVAAIQLYGSRCIYVTVKGKHEELLDTKMKRKIIKLVIDGMSWHCSDASTMENFCFVLHTFKIPDLSFDYQRLIIILQSIITQHYEDDLLLRHGVILLSRIACQVDGVKRQLLRDCGLIADLLQVVCKRLQEHICDDVMEGVWNLMSVLTDGSSSNGSMFIKGNGVILFLLCLKEFPIDTQLLSIMLRLLGNVAEIKKLRCHLMRDEYLTTFSQLLNHEKFEVSYSASRIISHIASVGPETWFNKTSVQRFQVLKQLGEAIERWNLDDKFVINYRSLKPTLQLLRCTEDIPEVQLWVVWTLANLTMVYPGKYCRLLREEGGTRLLCRLQFDSATCKIQMLARFTMNNCSVFKCIQH